MDPIILDLTAISGESELVAPVAHALSLAASVTLERLQEAGERYAADIHIAEDVRRAEIRRMPIAQPARDTYGDPQEATEEGAEGVGVLFARRVLNQIVFARLPKRTGADYRMRAPDSIGGDNYERLECSGIGDGQETGPSRLRDKIEQLRRFPGPPGHAVVTHFRMRPVEIHHGRDR